MPDQIPELTLDPSDPDFFQNPYPAYNRMQHMGPAFYWKEYGHICFAGYNQVNAILRDRRFGREITHVMSREEAGLSPVPPHLETFYAFESNSMLEREPPAHTRLRKLVNRAFVSRHIEQLTPQIEVLCHELIDQFPANHPFDLLPAYCEKIPVIVIADLLGVPREMANQLLDWSHKMVAMYQFNRSRETEDNAVRATNEFSTYVRGLAEERRFDPRDDLLSALVQAESSGESLSMDELVTTAILLLNAGHEATVHSIGNSVKCLLQSGTKVTDLFSSEQMKSRAIEELLRIDPPLHMFTRFVLEDLEFEKISLRKGQTVGLLLGAANHDPARYQHPHQLDFERGGEAHTSFGAGIHFCLGAPLARLEMGVALPILFSRCPDISLCQEPLYADRYHFHGLQNLMVAIRS